MDNNKNILSKIKIIPVVTYANAHLYKSIIYKYNKNQSGIYRWTHKKSGKSYVGSSRSLSKRFAAYYSKIHIKKKLSLGSSAIYSALLKYDYSNFSLDIIEYCEPNILISREQYYIDLLKPVYNILKIAGSSSGYKHTFESRLKMGQNPRYNCNIKLIPNLVEDKTKLNLFSRCKGIKVNITIFDKSNNLVNQFPCIRNAAKHFGVSDNTIQRILNKSIIHEGFIYKFEVKDLRV